MLHGRARELETLRARLRAARQGASFAAVVIGEAGIGKTSLLRAVLDEATGFRVLRARGFEGEAEIPYAGLLEIVRPLLDLAEGLPEQQAAALRSALALGPPTPHDRFAVPVSVLGLLGAAAEEGPVLVAVDDAHWLDAATREALLFAARRLQAEGVGVLLGVRGDLSDPPFDLAGLEVLALGGLDAEGARALLADRVAPGVADALAGATGGNPLALVELPGVLSEDERRGLTPISTPLPTAGRIEQLFSEQVAALPERARRAVGAAAAVDDGAIGQLFAALPALGLGEQDLGPAEQAGVVAVRGARLTFRHPLVRAAAYHAQTVAERRTVHAALADAADDVRAAAWHRAQATTGPDEDVARALAEAADDALRRGGRAEAARTYARAADLTPDPAVAAGRRLAAAAAAHDAGDGDLAEALLGAAEAGPLGEDERGHARRLRALLRVRAGDAAGGVPIFEEEAARLAPVDPVQAAWTLLLSAPGPMHSGDFPAMEDIATRAAALAGDADPTAAALAADLLALARNALGAANPDASPSLIEAAHRPVTTGPWEVAIAAAEGLVHHEHFASGLAALDRHVEAARREGAVLMLMYALATRAELHHASWRWAQARADAEEAVELHRVVDQDTIFSGHVFAIAAVVAMDTGRMAEARELVAASLASVERSGAGTLRQWSLWVAGRLAGLEGDHPTAVARLAELEALRARLRWGSPGIGFSGFDAVDSLLALGLADEARRLVTVLRRSASRGPRLPAAVACRIEGQLTEDDAEAEEAFAAALALHGEVDVPFERARTLLALGRRRRRSGDEDPVAPLREALGIFERLGAETWRRPAADELRASGSRHAGPAHSDPALVLSGQEFRVAELVARGLTNREVGGELFLSPKTIEHHLSTIYRKLGVRSRTELSGLLGARSAV